MLEPEKQEQGDWLEGRAPNQPHGTHTEAGVATEPEAQSTSGPCSRGIKEFYGPGSEGFLQSLEGTALSQ